MQYARMKCFFNSILKRDFMRINFSVYSLYFWVLDWSQQRIF